MLDFTRGCFFSRIIDARILMGNVAKAALAVFFWYVPVFQFDHSTIFYSLEKPYVKLQIQKNALFKDGIKLKNKKQTINRIAKKIMYVFGIFLHPPRNYVFGDMQSAMPNVFEIHRAQEGRYSPRSISSLGWLQLPKGCCYRLLPPTTGKQFLCPSQQVPKDHVHLGWSAIRVWCFDLSQTPLQTSVQELRDPLRMWQS